jgi:hypothetical protein
MVGDTSTRFGGLPPILLAAMAAACGSEGVTSSTEDFPVRFVVSNALLAPVTISIDGNPHVILTGGRSTGLTVPSTAQWLTWTSAKPMDSNGRPIPDDVGEVEVAISGINGVLEITNVIADQKYITARVFNNTNVQVSIGVYDGASVSCAGVLPAATSLRGFVQIGYYRLTPATEVRAYRDAPGCTGAHNAWPSSELTGFASKSGLLTLSLDSAP